MKFIWNLLLKLFGRKTKAAQEPSPSKADPKIKTDNRPLSQIVMSDIKNQASKDDILDDMRQLAATVKKIDPTRQEIEREIKKLAPKKAP